MNLKVDQVWLQQMTLTQVANNEAILVVKTELGQFTREIGGLDHVSIAQAEWMASRMGCELTIDHMLRSNPIVVSYFEQKERNL